MLYKIGFILFSLVISFNRIMATSLTEVDVIRNAVTDWVECSLGESLTNCLEERTIRNVRELNVDFANDLSLDMSEVKRTGKNIDGETNNTQAEELDPIEFENRDLLKKINERKTEPRGIIDEIGDLFAYFTFKLLNPFTGGANDDDESNTNVEKEDGKLVIEERGHKKKELKKKNKQLKIILLLMLLKNKIKMFVNKLQFLVQLKFLLVATVNMLANVIRLWIELKKKHKPNKVVYYENAHHQHHYDHEHIHDHDDGHYSHPGSYSHHAHHEEEDYGGGPWPWSRSYVEKQGEHAFQTINAYRRRPGSHSVVYMNQRPLR